jgi:hypothetical protein
MAALFGIGLLIGLLFKPNETKQVQPNVAVEIVQDPSDVLRNPYTPPVRTACSEIVYSQMGYLSQGQRRVPLFGRRAGHRDKWYYYTEIDGIKLPVKFKERSCTASPGCDMVSCRDVVRVADEWYDVTVYENDAFTYNPFV